MHRVKHFHNTALWFHATVTFLNFARNSGYIFIDGVENFHRLVFQIQRSVEIDLFEKNIKGLIFETPCIFSDI